MFDRMLPAAATKAWRDALTGKRAPTDSQDEARDKQDKLKLMRSAHFARW